MDVEEKLDRLQADLDAALLREGELEDRVSQLEEDLEEAQNEAYSNELCAGEIQDERDEARTERDDLQDKVNELEAEAGDIDIFMSHADEDEVLAHIAKKVYLASVLRAFIDHSELVYDLNASGKHELFNVLDELFDQLSKLA